MEKYKKISYRNNKYKNTASTWNDKFKLPDGLYFVLDIQHYFEYVKKNHETMTDKSTVKIYINRITFKTKLGYYLEL